jgi:diguanylate cyclase (GGDEF)-like protein
VSGTLRTVVSRPWAVILISLASVAVFGYIDLVAGEGVRLSVAYAAPVALSAWYGGRMGGVLLSAVVAFVINWTEAMSGGPALWGTVFLVNVPLVMAFFLLIVVMLDVLKRSLRHEKAMARIDPLTGVANSRQFRESTALEIARARRSRRPMSALYLDIDDFKGINDTLGHECGDDTLRVVADLMTHSLRATDIFARMGGDEFCAVLPDTGPQAAMTVAEKIREGLQTPDEGACSEIAVSLGVATFLRPPLSIEEIVHAADQTMYEVKGSGKGAVRQVVVDGDESDAGLRSDG